MLEAMPRPILAMLEDHIAERDRELKRTSGSEEALLANQLLHLKKQNLPFRKVGLALLRVLAYYLPEMDSRMKELDKLNLNDCRQYWQARLQALRETPYALTTLHPDQQAA